MFAIKSNASAIGVKLSVLAMCVSVSGFASAHSGDLNKHFGTDGTVTIPADVRIGQNERIVVDDSNRILCGYGVNPDSAEIGALDATGHIDTTFGTAGFVALADLYDIKVDSRNRYVVLGNLVSGTTDVTVLRYRNNGTLDKSFGVDGIATVKTGSRYGASQLALDDDDNIVVAGGESAPLGPEVLFAARLLKNGTLDTAFGKNGFRTIPAASAGGDTIPQAVAVDHAGNVYLSGYTLDGPAIVNQLVKLTSDGNLDKHFGGGSGFVTTDMNPSSSTHYTFAQSIAIDAKDNVVIAGGAGTYSGSQTFVVRFLPDGTVDPTFNGGAYASFPVGASINAQAQTVVIDGRGRMVLTGIAADGGPDRADFFAVRLKKDGEFDNTFTGGILRTAGWKGAGAVTNEGNVLIFGESATEDSVVIDELKGNSPPESAVVSDGAAD